MEVEFEAEVVSEDGDAEDLEGLPRHGLLLRLLGLVSTHTLLTLRGRGLGCVGSEDDLAYDEEVRLVCGQAQHDQIRIGAVQTVTQISVIPAETAHPSDDTATHTRVHSLTPSSVFGSLSAPLSLSLSVCVCVCVVYPGCDLCARMKAMILCSPSPGLLASERMTLMPFHPGLLIMRSWM